MKFLKGVRLSVAVLFMAAVTFFCLAVMKGCVEVEDLVPGSDGKSNKAIDLDEPMPHYVPIK